MKAVISAVDEESIYDIPVTLYHEGLDTIVCDTLKIDLDEHPIDLEPWESVVTSCAQHHEYAAHRHCGKYVTMPDAYLSVGEAVRHARIWYRRQDQHWLARAERVPARLTPNASVSSTHHRAWWVRRTGHRRHDRHGPDRARTRYSLLGICLGMQIQVIEFAASARSERAQSTSSPTALRHQ